MIEIRYSIARVLKQNRRKARITQAVLAGRIGTTRNTISRIERASNRVSLDHAVRALIELGCSDTEIANAFNPGLDAGIQQLRLRAAVPLFPKPAVQSHPVRQEHRFFSKCPPYRDPLHQP